MGNELERNILEAKSGRLLGRSRNAFFMHRKQAPIHRQEHYKIVIPHPILSYPREVVKISNTGPARTKSPKI